jgi:BirA family transcriptional regulator, biotin operon repressor / biotin---[acetyl-CoA-carboxylase] ligase
MPEIPDRPLVIASIAAALGSLASRFDVDVVAECASTNTLLMARADSLPSGAVVAAERQTAGRGRMGRIWHAAPDDSLTFSLLWRLPRGVSPSGLSLAVGVGVAEALRELGAADVTLKWPNDILRDGKKLGGILIELASTSAIIGIGLNLLLPADLPEDVKRNAAPLGVDVDRNDLLARLLASLHGVLESFNRGGFAALRERWLALNAYADAPVRILSEFAATLEGRCAGVDADGALLLQTACGVRRVISGDVSLRAA